MNWGLFFKILGGGAFAVGLGAGVSHLVDKSKIDNLEEQVQMLQEREKELIQLLESRDEHINKLILKLKINSVEQLIGASSDQKLRVMLKYALKEYADIYVKQISGEDIFENDLSFFNKMDKFIEGKNLSTEDMKAIVNRVNIRYGSQIDVLVEPNLQELINKIRKNQ